MKHNKLKNAVRIIQISSLAILGCSFAYSDNTAPIKAAIAFSEGNKYDITAQQMIEGIQTAKSFFEKQNSSYKVELISYSFKPHNSASVAKTAEEICKAKIPVVIGAEMSEEAMVMGKILNSCHVILLSPTATNVKVSEGKPYVFTMSTPDDAVSRQFALFVHDNLKDTKVGVIHDVSLPYPDGLSNSFINHYSRLSSNEIIAKKVLRETTDYSQEIDDFILKNINVVVMLTYDIDLKRFSSQAAEKGYFPVYIGSDGWGSNESVIKYIKSNPSYKNRFTAYRNICWKADSKARINFQFKSAFLHGFNKQAGAFNAIGFDSAWVVFSAFKHKNESKTGKTLRDILSSIHDIKLTTSNAFYFKNNIPVREMHIYKISPEKIQYVTSIMEDK